MDWRNNDSSVVRIESSSFQAMMPMERYTGHEAWVASAAGGGSGSEIEITHPA
jgi:hypothetical protein